jgi:hypothetical protein
MAHGYTDQQAVPTLPARDERQVLGRPLRSNEAGLEAVFRGAVGKALRSLQWRVSLRAPIEPAFS